MASETTKEKALLDEPQGTILEDASGEPAIPTIRRETGPGIESESGDDLFPAVARIKNIG